MIYDNKYALTHATRLVDQYTDREELIREVSGELMRFYRLGQESVIGPVSSALTKANNTKP